MTLVWRTNLRLLRVLCTFALLCEAYRYDPRYVDWNLNTNKDTTNPLDYSGQWTGHQYTPSPGNWRFPFYTIFPDRFVNGDPTNDDVNRTSFEHDINSNQLRHGGDMAGLVDTLDYIHGMGIKGIYLAGSPFMNEPWGYDQYSPIDLSILDMHFGTLDTWRSAINEIHARGMYVIIDNTFATLGDLIGFDGYLNGSAPFTLKEYQVSWKTDAQYWDFHFGNSYNDTCDYPPFWNESGYPLQSYVTDNMKGCYASEFDQYGDTEAFGVYPNWRRQLSNFASVQDRLREWHTPVRQKLEVFYCMVISQLDVDGMRYDKATQATVDALGAMNDAMRTCARKYGKENFFMPGEITPGNDFGSIYVGRGRQPDMLPANFTQAATLTPNSSMQYFLREPEHGALDSAAFHYTVYRTLTRFLGMDGELAAGYDAPLNWVDQWNTYLLTNDFINSNTGEFDPRHMMGTTDQDVFRWPGITNGVERQLLGHYITSILMPGLPLILWGEEQAFYILDSTADNYIFGRQAMSTATAWQMHGCYHLGSTQFYNMPLDSARHGCSDDMASLDHRDPSAPVRNILRHMFQLREAIPVLNDGFALQQLSNQTWDVLYPGSSGVVTETGMYSVLRSGLEDVQDFGGEGYVWLVYTNYNTSMTYEFHCDDTDTSLNSEALIAPFVVGTVVKNLFYPFDSHTLVNSTQTLYIGNATEPNGCLSSLLMQAYDFRAYVPIEYWVEPLPMITKFSPGHDARLISTVSLDETEELEVEIQFSTPMDCDSVTDSITFKSTTELNISPSVLNGSVECGPVSHPENITLIGAVQSTWAWSAKLTNVASGVHSLTVHNASASNASSYTNSNDKFMFRVGNLDNPMVFQSANYSMSLLTKLSNGTLLVNHSAAGADMFRYSTNFGSSFSDWMPYTGGVHKIEKQPWSGTHAQAWEGEHLRVEYFSKLSGSSDHVQQGDVGTKARRFPHLFLEGDFNTWGYDAGLPNQFELIEDYTWERDWMVEWAGVTGSVAQVNVWGMNPDGEPDQTMVMGDVDEDSILDHLPPSYLATVALNITRAPPKPYLSWKITINDGNLRFTIVPAGAMWHQIALYFLLAIVPILTASLSCWAFAQTFYKIKYNEVGIQHKEGLMQMAIIRPFHHLTGTEEAEEKDPRVSGNVIPPRNPRKRHFGHRVSYVQRDDALQVSSQSRRTVLIATMEYDIEDWSIRVKIGGLGVMAQLMGKNLGHQDLIWVIPCVGGLEYPVDERADPMFVTILGKQYEVNVQYHKLRNITYVLLDAPVFRQQTKAEPYPPRMDDMDSAIYYSTWNQCIAQALTRFPIDLYHINDYHGTIASLYLLPKTIPVCLSLHNAEFQGLWPIRNRKEREEVCSVFNLNEDVVQKYVQYGEIFNLLHAGASLLRVQQAGFGAVGVSKKYGKRAYSRYPIFWGLRSVQALPNPDPTDTGEWDKKLPKEADMKVDSEWEAERLKLRVEAQKWAGLEEDPTAELFVFVGRWSNQKGIDLIADVFPSVLESNRNVQLICVGPVIDLYGKFAALKLDRLMELYPKRVFSKPEFTQLPPYIFSGAEFALIPSRDEPFGLVAVEFGRKGALGVGARVGGLGQMPGWWFTVESMTPDHLSHQLKEAIHEAMSSPTATRAKMRARSAKQRFPVAQWVEDLEILQTTSIRIHNQSKALKSSISSAETLVNLGISTLRTGYAHSPAEVEAPAALLTPIRPSSPPDPDELRTRLKIPTVGAESPPESFDSSHPHSIEHREAAFGSTQGPGHVVREDYNDGVAEQGLGEGKTFVGSTPNERATRVRRTTSTQLLPQPWLIGSNHSESDGESDCEMDVEAIYSAYSAQPEALRSAVPLARYPGQVDHDSWDVTENNSAQWPLTHSGLPSPASIPSGFPSPRLGASSHSEAFAPLQPPPRIFDANHRPLSSRSMVSVNEIVGARKDFNLQKVDPFFTDSNGYFYEMFKKKLATLDKNNSETSNCIQGFLVKSEKQWFNSFRDAKLGRHLKDTSSRPASIMTPRSQRGLSRASSFMSGAHTPGQDEMNHVVPGGLVQTDSDEFLLGKDYKPPRGVRKWMQVRVLSWPMYAYLIALGQIIAANSYQITLLTGTVGETADKLYAIASLYLVSSICWWFLFRRVPSFICLSLPFLFYGIAFFLIGVGVFASYTGDYWMQNLATGFYAIASSSGALFFALNFGDEGGAQVKSLVFRACVIQGTQQIYVAALWYWGSILTTQSAAGETSTIAGTWKITAITLPIALTLWAVGVVLWTGLPDYYRQTPGKIPSFYRSILRRRVVLWFFFMALVQNFFLSAPYGRNWGFLFKSTHAATWQVVLLILLFFVGVWSGLLAVFAKLSKSHSWILPLFAIGLGAPRWAQIWWGTSNIGLWLPWAGGFVSSALISRALWLWLGVLDAIQGVGIGMIMLGTLTRIHVAFAVVSAQVLGSVATIAARGFAPNNIGPGPISPDISGGLQPMRQAWFWIGLLANLLLCVGFYKFYRKEQLLKP